MTFQPLPPPRIPRATYRLQFNERFRLADGAALVPYLADLGISHLYTSPLFRACAHSVHGYDVCDYHQLNPELGTETDLMHLVTALREHGLGLMLDIVPNHMGVWTPENRWWWDVLKHGPASEFARYFDIDWQSPNPQLHGKVLAPLLSDDYDKVLQRGELQIVRVEQHLLLKHFEHLLPLTPGSLPGEAGAECANGNSKAVNDWLKELGNNQAALDTLIRQQHYLPVCWREADTRLNYRRFFGIVTLAAVRVEDEDVFKDSHALVRSWLKHGWVDALRVDHPDGLRDPGQYLQRLREKAPTAWIVVEKILEPEEMLPPSWPVAGTTGYDFLNIVNGVLVDPDGEKPLTEFYQQFTSEPVDYGALVREKKRLVLSRLLVAEMNRLTGLFTQIAERHLAPGESNIESLRQVLTELVVNLPAYRTYIRADEGTVAKSDTGLVKAAAAGARRHQPGLNPKHLQLLCHVLLLKFDGELEREFIARFQQLTGSAMAKGVEDSAFYCFNRLMSLNDVGCDPAKFGVGLEQFHEFCARQQSRHPNAMVATSTHDTKRSEDVRARINLLSEIPGQWEQTVKRWTLMNERHRRDDLPDRNMEYLFYQTLVGAWPCSVERLQAYIEKASCEAGQRTSWTQRNADYDQALRSFVAGALSDAAFISEINRFLQPLAEAGYVNSISQTLLKLTAPGVPDNYQGCELWDLSLVDPDNRRPVDFEIRQRLLAEASTLTVEDIWLRRDSGLPKLWMIRKVLHFRKQHPALFDGSSRYHPLNASGEKAGHVIAFMRGNGSISVAPRFWLKLGGDWADTALRLPEGRWRNELTGEDIEGDAVLISMLLRKFPAALLVRKDAA